MDDLNKHIPSALYVEIAKELEKLRGSIEKQTERMAGRMDGFDLKMEFIDEKLTRLESISKAAHKRSDEIEADIDKVKEKHHNLKVKVVGQAAGVYGALAAIQWIWGKMKGGM